ncbi:uncharacterized protein LOC122277671 isoform X2 [Carya illinoinensis]|uniref:uncharacterized protein LOC122277671 isoform X2 n=1 Tax=Carya illinoinensis TaxID=32201 RepID=UPI001C723EC3|nr:uncharacterized protein LOC122277671 isoform X2 [Carya illinoinensis]
MLLLLLGQDYLIQGIPQLQNRLKGPKWLPFIVGLPPLLLFSGASVAFGGLMCWLQLIQMVKLQFRYLYKTEAGSSCEEHILEGQGCRY